MTNKIVVMTDATPQISFDFLTEEFIMMLLCGKRKEIVLTLSRNDTKRQVAIILQSTIRQI